ncbi:MAG: DUF6596 domain-containing protein, partial [Pseudomonadota bacterium]
MADPQIEARRAAEAAARQSYGKLVAILAAQFRNVARAEDAVADAFRKALETWPDRGLPDRPEAWLATAAKRRIIDDARKAGRRRDALPHLERLLEERQSMPRSEIPDERLRLIFACADPAIDPAMRAPLILQAVLGFDAAAIGSAFLVSPATMGQRLVRAKHKIAASGAAFTVPDSEDLPARLPPVLDAIYAGFGLGWSDPASDRTRDLSEEAIWLASLIGSLLPEAPEPKGLLALMLFAHARRAARRNPDGAYVPLDDQDTGLWDAEMIRKALEQMTAGAKAGPPGRYMIEAAIQSNHVARWVGQPVDRARIGSLYDDLWAAHPTVSVFIGRAASRADTDGPEAGLALLGELGADQVAAYQPYWSVKAELHHRAGQIDAARDAFS